MSAHLEFSRRVALHRLGRDPLVETLRATPDECAALAARLSLPKIEALECRYRLTLGDQNNVLAEGWLSAKVTLSCVITDEPFDDVVTEDFLLRFVPAFRFSEEKALELDATDEIPYEGNAIDFGEVTTEQLALTLPPYPRRPGAALEHGVDEVPPVDDAVSEDGEERPHPFAGLAALSQGKTFGDA